MSGSAHRRIGVLGGTFDPMHNAHTAIATEVKRALDLDLVLFVPTGEPWQKEHYSNAEDRFMMTVLGTGGVPGFAVSRIEIDRRGPTYTLDTMVSLTAFYGEGTDLFFIVGADAAAQLGTWKKVEELGAYCEVVTIARPGFAHSDIITKPGWPALRPVTAPLMDISATDIRERVRARRPYADLVPAPVARYIEERGLYREGSRSA
jgi:nicotinate-nucleotide adenylyltransferase